VRGFYTDSIDGERTVRARAIAGIYDSPANQRPVLDEIPGVSGLFVAAGFSGTGFKTSPAGRRGDGGIDCLWR